MRWRSFELSLWYILSDAGLLSLCVNASTHILISISSFFFVQSVFVHSEVTVNEGFNVLTSQRQLLKKSFHKKYGIEIFVLCLKSVFQIKKNLHSKLSVSFDIAGFSLNFSMRDGKGKTLYLFLSNSSMYQRAVTNKI